ncbi:MAG: aminotransferase class III-fold pyridoxal phosphate-dependent enzyme [Thaumarchaeota archaeon]|nr:aminotransferase class III-fold pyridoxal phosphate-dependent enzyme [Nitrososphaerota archaeon]
MSQSPSPPLQRLLESYEAQYVAQNKTSRELFERAKGSLAGGVTGNMKLMRPYPHPLYFTDARGSKVYDVDGHEYIDTITGAGTQILGHCHPAIVEAIKQQVDRAIMTIYPTELEPALAEKIIKHCPHMELLRFTNTGSEAATMVLRTARAYTGRDKIGKFEGNWHGQHDLTLVSGTSAPAGGEKSPEAVPDTPGLPRDIPDSVVVLPYNNAEASVDVIRKNAKDLAAVIIEPVCVFQCGVVAAEPEFLRALREVTEANDIPLIFDEVITGFRLGLGGATELLGVKPDMAIYGKIIGGGLPIGAFGGRREIMEKSVSPLVAQGASGVKILHSGSFTGNPVSLAAGLAMLRELENIDPYPYLESITQEYKQKVTSAARDLGMAVQINALGSFYQILFTDRAPRHKRDVMKADAFKQRVFSTGMTINGVVIIPAHPGLMSYAHTRDDVKSMIETSQKVLAQMASSEAEGGTAAVRAASPAPS